MAKLQSKILSCLKRRKDVWCIKVEMANERGCPDILCCVGGEFVAIEVKDGNDRLSTIQVWQLILIETANGLTMVAKDYDKWLAEFEGKFGK